MKTRMLDTFGALNVLSYSLRGFEVFLKVPAIIIMRFCENNVLGTMYIDIINFGGGRGGYIVRGSHDIFLFIIHKK